MLSVYRDYGVVEKDSRSDNFNRTADDRNIYQLVEDGWLVTNRMKAWQGSVGISLQRGIVSGHYICFRPQHSESDDYLNWLFRSPVYTAAYHLISRGVRPSQAEIDNDDYRVLPVVLPPIEEQRQIARYLQSETGKIDTLVAKQEQLIEVLRERRAAVIADAVTMGLNPEAPTMDSGADWVGAVPRHWTIAPLKRFGSVKLGKMLQSESSNEEDIQAPYLRAANVQPDGVLAIEDVKTMWFAPDELATHDLTAADVVVVEGGIGGYGRAAYLKEPIAGAGFQNSINRVRPFRPNDGRYLTYFLIMARHVGYIAAYCDIVSMPHLTAEKLEAMRMPIPPPEEQRAIADFLDEQTSGIDTLIDTARQFIDLSRERRAALVAGMVTGQMDVRSEATPGAAA
jgi:type I restriction enzyme S subunit